MSMEDLSPDEIKRLLIYLDEEAERLCPGHLSLVKAERDRIRDRIAKMTSPPKEPTP